MLPIGTSPLFLLTALLLLLVPLFECGAILIFISVKKENEPFKGLSEANQKTYSAIPVIILILSVVLFLFDVRVAAFSISTLNALYLTSFSALLFAHNKSPKTRIRCVFILLLSAIPNLALLILLPLVHMK